MNWASGMEIFELSSLKYDVTLTRGNQTDWEKKEILIPDEISPCGIIYFSFLLSQSHRVRWSRSFRSDFSD